MRAWARVIFVVASLSFFLPAAAFAQSDEEVDDSWAPFVAVSVGGIWPDLTLTAPSCPPACPPPGVILVRPEEVYFGFEVAASAGLDMTWLRWDVVEIAYDRSHSKAATSGPSMGGTTSLLSLGTGFRVGPFRKGWSVYPYLSLGFAGGQLKTNGTGVFEDFSDWGFEWNGGIGLEARVFDRLRVGMRYRYRSLSIEVLPDLGLGEYSAELNLHTLSLELVY